MGMYTSIRHPKTFEEIQIKTGDDFLLWYNIGDKVERFINPDVVCSGCCFDGAYDGLGDNKKYIVIIDNQIISEIIDNPYDDEDEFWELYRKYTNKYPEKIPYSEYTYLALIKYFLLELKRKVKSLFTKVKNKRLYKKLIKLYGKEEGRRKYFGYLSANPIRKKLDYVGIAKKFISVKTFPEGKELIFDKEKKI